MRAKFSNRDHCRLHHRCRLGVTALENAIVLPILLMILFVSLELALVTLRYNTLAEGARKLARTASLRGEDASPRRTTWGPSAYSENARSQTGPAQEITDLFVGMDRSQVQVELKWIDGSHQVNDRVQATVSYVHQPICNWFGSSLNLQAVSTVRIRH